MTGGRHTIMNTATERDRQLHQHLLDGDPTASARVAEAYLAPVFERLCRRHREVRDEALLYDAATDAVLDYTEHPTRYDPEKLPLLSYLAMAANGDLLNAIAREQRRAGRVVSLHAVVDDDPARNRYQEPGVEDEIDLDRLTADPARRELAERLRREVPDPRDRQLVALLLDGVRRTEPYAAILGITVLEPAEQRTIANRHKDRLKKRLRRLGVKLRERPA